MKIPGMNRIPMICSMAIMISAAQAEVYKTVDENGNVVYTDQAPSSGAEPMKLRELSVVPVPEYASKQKAAQTAGLEEGGEVDLGALRRGYRDFSLVSPAAEQTFTGSGNVAVVEWSTRFELQPGMAVIVHIDGEALPPTTQAAITTPPLDRGEHQVRADLVDAQKRNIASAGPVTFFVHQNSANFSAPARAGGG